MKDKMCYVWPAILGFIVGGLLMMVICSAMADSSTEQAKCYSLGGIPDGVTCWYSGEARSIEDIKKSQGILK
ncbi:MAG: hypothetical protein Q4C83_01050 [Candidatus Saccharibacteria bacterium]|nr:hypothetical protein [Candidatus Saccharibacteria bacterium]